MAKADDDLSDILVEVIAPEDGGLSALPKKADGTPDIDVKERTNAAEEARKAAEAELGEQWRKEREQLVAERNAEREARDRIEARARERIEAERKGREEAEGQRDERTEWAKTAHWQVLQERKKNFQTGLETMSAYIDELEHAIEKASEAGDHAGVAKLNRKMAESMTAKATYDAANKRIDEEIDDVKRRFSAESPKEKEPAKKEAAEPEFDLDEWINNSPEVTQPWLKEHKADLAKPKFMARVVAFARSYGLDSDDPKALESAQFVTALNEKFFPQEAKTMKDDTEDKGKTAKAEAEAEAEAEPETRTGHAAPVSRNSRPAQPSNSATVRLTQDEFNMAPNLYSSYDEFSPEIKAKFPAWSETAARWQYDFDKKRAKAAGKYDR